MSVVEAVAPARAKKWRRCREDVDTILARSSEPWVTLRLAGGDVADVRPGGIVLLVGGTGRGKTSLAATLLVNHARDFGPAIAMSLELPADEWTARVIGGRCDASWPAVLRGELTAERMLQVIPERLARIDREDASLGTLCGAIDDLKGEYSDQPILVAVDYVQLVGADGEDDIRPRIGRTMRQLDRVARDRRVVLIALSQGSRASARALSMGERVGAETTDAGAESADLERWATVTLAIGHHGAEADDGTCAVDISLGKGRMSGGDRVIPARYCGRSGDWRISGDARSAAEVRADRDKERAATKVGAACLALAKAAQDVESPLTREELGAMACCHKSIWQPAIATLLGRGELVEVQRRKPRSRAWMVWTRARAEASGVPVVADVEAER